VCEIGGARAGDSPIQVGQGAESWSVSEVKARNLFLAENQRQVQHLLGIRCLNHAPGLLESLDVEEAQGREPLGDGVGSQLELLEQRDLVLANVIRTQLIGGTAEILSEMFDGADVAVDGGPSVVASLEFFEHDLA
jgi:hypothetical protein